MKKKVLFVADSKLTFSEAPPSRFIYIAKSLKRKGLEVEIIGRKGEKIEELETTQLGGAKHISRFRILFYTYIGAIRHSYTAIIVRGELLAFLLLPLKILRTKLILDFHGWLYKEIETFYEKTIYNTLKAAFYCCAEKATVKYYNIIICNSQGFQRLLGQEEAKSIVLENGVDVKESEKARCEAEREKEQIYEKYFIQKNKPLTCFLGNWHEYDDLQTMFRGAEIAEAGTVVIGEGPGLNQLKRAWSNVTFTGRLKRYEALKVVQLCTIAIVPLRSIYYPTRKLKDYLSLAKPIIMTSVKGIEDYLIPNKNVLLYEPGNPEDLADKIKTLISNKELANEMSQNNLALARRFDWQALVEKSGVIEKILKD